VEDINGVQLDLPVPPIGDGATAPTMIFDPPIAGNQLSLDTGFGAEAFFYLATSRITIPAGRAELTLGIEAAYGGDDPLNVPPDQFLFSRVRVRFDATVAGDYTVTHPWGVENLTVTDADVNKRFSHTFDWGGLAPFCPDQPSCFPTISESPGFERLLVSPKSWYFLRAGSLAAGVDPNSWIGDGVTETTALDINNVAQTFRIDGPADAFGPGASFVESSLFTVSGHIFGGNIPPPPPPPPTVTDTVSINQARYTARKATLEIKAKSTDRTAGLTAYIGGTPIGVLVKGTLKITPFVPAPAPGTVVTVKSDKGGSATATVQIK
jgi:hypothetical protein